MQDLSRNEEVILLSIWRLKENAYGVTIRRNVMEVTKRKLHYGSLYNTSDSLIRKGLVVNKESQPISVKGGRRKKLYYLTNRGKDALQSLRQFQNAAWDGIPKFAFKGDSSDG